jgi:hypothetical protein
VRRSLIWTAVALFFAFEASRAVWLSEFLWPIWKFLIVGTAAMPLPAQIVTVLAFLAPMAGVLFALRWLHRRLSRNGTVVNSLLTKLNFR